MIEFLFLLIALGVWFMIGFWYAPKLARHTRVPLYIKEAEKYCLFADRYVNVAEIIYLNNMDVREILLCWIPLCDLLNQHNFKYDTDRCYSLLDLVPHLSDRYSENKIDRYFEKKAVARFLKKYSTEVQQ